MKDLWEAITNFVVDNVARLVILGLGVFALLLTVGYIVAKFKKGGPFFEQAVSKHNQELRDKNSEINEYSAERVEEIRGEIIDKEVEEVWNLWSSTFKKPRG